MKLKLSAALGGEPFGYQIEIAQEEIDCAWQEEREFIMLHLGQALDAILRERDARTFAGSLDKAA